MHRGHSSLPGRVHTEEGSRLSRCPVVLWSSVPHGSWFAVRCVKDMVPKNQAAAIRWSKCCTSPRWVCHPTSTTLWGGPKRTKRQMTAYQLSLMTHDSSSRKTRGQISPVGSWRALGCSLAVLVMLATRYTWSSWCKNKVTSVDYDNFQSNFFADLNKTKQIRLCLATMSEATQRKLPELHFAVLAILSVVEQGREWENGTPTARCLGAFTDL